MAGRLELGVPGQIMPPAAAAVKFAKRSEDEGFDAVWWPDHLMGWHPDTMWTPDLTPLAEHQANPHVYFDPAVMMGVVGAATERIRVGVCVTDLIRRHPAMAAQTALTLDHVTQGRAIIGLGSGEQLNATPYGMPFDRPVARLEEGIDVMRLLMTADGPVDHEGRFLRLERAVLGLQPYGATPPEIWTAAHGPRMLRLTGRKADGWLPTKLSPAEYCDALTTIRTAADQEGRDPDAITPGMLGYVLMGPDAETVQRLTEAPLVRALCVLLPAQVFRDLGVEGPYPDGSGFHDFIPTAIDRAESLRIIDAIPPAVVRHYAFCGTPDEVAEQVEEYVEKGLRHLVMWNITAFGDPGLARWSFGAMSELRKRLGA
ncbi:LLM class flavin-dependent oxidoreductase [Actinomycetospora lutea]|uniref:LLM class flavin-dependent oxidoreductase n=1 Tax=Actinomycetospora lutea TaxID=663604 RepID=UPI0023651E56|nr:LLM class flavin-dependent oxidoreductase [Actinomycetospora lutea]MDD7941360.1 LLM class flavin-dependent oxidoreductase [Actinomycetospora lutea]